MLFNSLTFAIFLPVVFLLFWFVFNRHLKLQNLFLLIVSYIFYGWWDWRFLALIAFSSLVDYIIGLRIYSTQEKNRRKLLLGVSLLSNLGLLGFFKYYNFFVESFTTFSNSIGFQANSHTLNIILPVGISFYTFQTLSYTIDIYRKTLKPTKDIVQFFAFVSFFPQLVAGPIERAAHLLPQFETKKTFNYDWAVSGARLILLGLFKKIVVADNCAVVVNKIFENYSNESPVNLLIGVIFFAFQIYGDFSGYSDIAIGAGRLLGFDLMTNFKTPYYSRNIAEFWRRWHISLSTWFRDYVYIPLGGSRRSNLRNVINIMIVFLVSGLWHGANWTFVFWGGINGIFFIPLLLSRRNKNFRDVVAQDSNFPNLKEIAQIGFTFAIVCLGWLFFRSATLSDAFHYIATFVSGTQTILDIKITLFGYRYLFLIIGALIFIEWHFRRGGFDIEVGRLMMLKRWSFYILIFTLIHFFGVYGKNQFIYFQF